MQWCGQKGEGWGRKGGKERGGESCVRAQDGQEQHTGAGSVTFQKKINGHFAEERYKMAQEQAR